MEIKVVVREREVEATERLLEIMERRAKTLEGKYDGKKSADSGKRLLNKILKPKTATKPRVDVIYQRGTLLSMHLHNDQITLDCDTVTAFSVHAIYICTLFENS